jgi:hypothetical protein
MTATLFFGVPPSVPTLHHLTHYYPINLGCYQCAQDVPHSALAGEGEEHGAPEALGEHVR